MHVTIVANGELPTSGHEQMQALVRSSDTVIAADGGLNHCHTLSIQYPAAKDATDLELALLEAFKLDPTRISVVAAFGGRLDHEVATLGLLASERWSAVPIVAVDGRRTVWFVHEEQEMALAIGATVSLVPIAGQASGVSFAGVQWPLHDATLLPGSTLGVSNVVTESHQRVAVQVGTLLAITDEL